MNSSSLAIILLLTHGTDGLLESKVRLFTGTNFLNLALVRQFNFFADL